MSLTMSQSSQSTQAQDLPKTNGPTTSAQDENKKPKEEVKKEKVKRENEIRRKLSEISAPKKRKILHKVMIKYHKDPYHEPIDIAKKILKKLKVNHTQYFMNRVRQDMDKWMAENVPEYRNADENSNNDSKKKVLEDMQKKKQSILAVNEEFKEKTPSEAEEAGPSEETKKPESDIKTSEAKVLPPLPQALCIKCNCKNLQARNSSKDPKESADSAIVKTEKEVPLIDLTVEVKKEIKEEIITIDEDLPNTSDTKTTETQQVNAGVGVPVIPYPVGYNTVPYFYPEGYYPYYDPNPQMYNPYIMPYGYQGSLYPYNPHFYSAKYNSDLLPNYPIDNDGSQDSKLISEKSASQPSDKNIYEASNANVPVGTNMAGTEAAEEPGKKP